MFGKLFGISKPVTPKRNTTTTRDLLRREATIGGTLFGPIPAGRSRQFFCLDEHSWIWHEGWVDQAGRHQSLTTRYEVRPTGILKAQGSQPYHYVSEEEKSNLLQAAKLYYQAVARDVYGRHVTI